MPNGSRCKGVRRNKHFCGILSSARPLAACCRKFARRTVSCMLCLFFGSAQPCAYVLLYKFTGQPVVRQRFPLLTSIQNSRDMKHESIVVVHDSCQAIAEEIADKLGAETVSVQSMNVRQIENSQSLVLAVEFQDGGNLSPHWQYASQMFRGASLSGKNLAVMVALRIGTTTASMPMPSAANSRRTGRTLLATIIYADSFQVQSITGSAPSRLTYKTITIMSTSLS